MRLPLFFQLFCGTSIFSLSLFSQSITQQDQGSEYIPEVNQQQDFQSSTNPNTSETNPRTNKELPPQQAGEKSAKTSFQPFTGKIIKNRVRMRLQPNLDSPIIKELSNETLLQVFDEQDDFYVIKPPEKMKGYVFRTYILDGIVEGTHVNVRLEPDTQSPALLQLNSGDKIEGTISQSNNKWLEITLPETVHFYVSKEFVQKIGDAKVFQKLEIRKLILTKTFDELNLKIQIELAKPFTQINLSPVTEKLQEIIQKNQDLPLEVQKAKELLQKIQEAYLQKGVQSEKTPQKTMSSESPRAEIENRASQESTPKQTQSSPTPPSSQSPSLSKPSAAQVQEITKMEQMATKQKNVQTPSSQDIWQGREDSLFAIAKNNGIVTTTEEFYKDQLAHAETFTGKLVAYDRPAKNKPGNYMLIDARTNLLIAFLYSTLVDLKPFIGKKIIVTGSPRENYNYSAHAYFVLEAKEAQ